MKFKKFYLKNSLHGISLFFLLVLFPILSIAKQPETTNGQNRCEQLLKEKGDLKEKMTKIKIEQESLQTRYETAQANFEKLKTQLDTMTGCTVGKADNTPECESILNGQREVANQLDKIQLLQRENSKKRLAEENKLLNIKANIQLLNCE